MLPLVRWLPPFRVCLKAWLLSLGGWGLLALAFAAQLVYAESFPWTRALLIGSRHWLPWGLLTPIVVWLALRFPLERTRWRWSVPVHLAACAVMVAASHWLSERALPRPGPPFGLGRHLWSSGANEESPARFELPFQGGPPFGPPGGFGGRRPFDGPAAILMRSRLNLPVYWVIVSATHALMFYRRSQERERKTLELSAHLAQAKLQALKMQLQPHFLFNTLNAISTLVHRDSRAADEMIGNLSEFLRLTLELSDQQELPLRRELEFVDHYLAIEQVRFGERLRVERDIASDTLDLRVPTLIFQPLVENAIRHGLEKSRGPGTLTLHAHREGSTLQIEITDSGIGLPAGEPPREGIGLANTCHRLRELYGDAAALVLRNRPQGGVTAEIRLPCRFGGSQTESRP